MRTLFKNIYILVFTLICFFSSNLKAAVNTGTFIYKDGIDLNSDTFVVNDTDDEHSDTFIYKSNSSNLDSPSSTTTETISASASTSDTEEDEFMVTLKHEIVRMIEADINAPKDGELQLGIVFNRSLFDISSTGSLVINPEKIRVEEGKGGNSTKALFQVQVNQKYIPDPTHGVSEREDKWRTVFVIKFLDDHEAAQEISKIRQVKTFFKGINLSPGKSLPSLTFDEKIVSILGQPALLLHAAKGRCLKDFLEDQEPLGSPEQTAVFHKFGQSLANFHQLYSPVVQNLADDRIQSINFEKSEKHPTVPDPIDENNPAFKTIFLSMRFKDAEEIQRDYQHIVSDPTSKCRKYLTSIIHGDAHAGNIFYSALTDKVIFIDNASLADTLPDDSTPSRCGGSIASDVAYSIATVGYFWGFMQTSYEGYIDIASHFLSGYLKQYPKGVQNDLLNFLTYKLMVWITFYKAEVPEFRMRRANSLNNLAKDFPSDLRARTLALLASSPTSLSPRSIEFLRKFSFKSRNSLFSASSPDSPPSTGLLSLSGSESPTLTESGSASPTSTFSLESNE